MEFEIVTLKSGTKSLRSLEHAETFHPATGPFDEAHVIHVQQQRLRERCHRERKLVLWDVGFGAAANVLAAIEALADCDAEIEIHSFDKTTAPIEFALRHQEELGYISGHERSLRRLLLDGQVRIQPRTVWNLHLGDFSDTVRTPAGAALPAPNAIFYDPYSPATNPEMWTLEHFTSIWRRLDPDTECMLTNYTRSTSMRVALLLAGFFVGVGCVIGEKAETTIAANRLELLAKPLDRKWLERVRVSRNSAPLRHSAYSQSGISGEDFERLGRVPQFDLV